MGVGSSLAFAANESAQTFTLDGQMLKTDNTPLLDANAKFKIQILSADKRCLLYEEEQDVDTTSNGYYNIQVGSVLNDGKRTLLDSGRTMAQVFQNLAPITAKNVPGNLPAMNCTGLSYSPSPGDARYFRLIITPSATMVADVLEPDTMMDSVASALVAQTFQGLEPNQFLQVGAGDLTQTLLQNVFALGNANKLAAMLANDPTNYLLKDPTNGTISLPMVANPASPAAGQIWYDAGQIKYYNGSGTQTVGVGTVTSVTAGVGLTVAGGSITTSGTLNVDVGNTVGKIVQVQTGNRLPALDGSLLTNIPSTAIQSGLISGAVTISTNAPIQTTSDLTSFRSFLYDNSGAGPGYVGFQAPADIAGSGGSSYILTFPNITGSAGQFLSTTGGGTLAWGGAVTSITAGSGLSGGVITGSGTISLPATGVAPGSYGSGTQVATFTVDALGRLTAAGIATITGAAPTGAAGGDLSGNFPSPTVIRIQGITISSAAPSASGQMLRYNGAQWGAASIVAGDLPSSVAFLNQSNIFTTGDQRITIASPSQNGLLMLQAASQTVPAFAVQNNLGSLIYALNPTGIPALNTDLTTKQYADSATSSAGANYVRRDGTSTLTGNWSAGNWTISAGQGRFTTPDGSTALTVEGDDTPTSDLFVVRGGPTSSPAIRVGSNTTTYLRNTAIQNWTPSSEALVVSGYGGQSVPIMAVRDGASNPLMVVDHIGRIGVGTLSPNHQFSIYNSGVSPVVKVIGGNTVGNDTPEVSLGVNATSIGGGMRISNATRATKGLEIFSNATYPISVDAAGGASVLLNSSGGNVGIGITIPTASLHLRSGAATASSAPLKFASGVMLATPEPGAMEYDGTNLYFTNASSQRITLSGGGGSYLPLSGGTLLGGLTLAGDPTAGLGAATKQYVDNAVSSTASGYVRRDGTSTLTGSWGTGAWNFGVGTISPGYGFHVRRDNFLLEDNSGNPFLWGSSAGGEGNGVRVGQSSAPVSKFDVINQGAKTSSSIGMLVQQLRTSGTVSISKVGLQVESTGAWNGSDASNIGLNVTVSGGTSNYAALFQGGRVGIGTANPSANLDVRGGGSGTTAAVFGRETVGISMMGDWPEIGFNTQWDSVDSRYESLNSGYGAVISARQDFGGLDFFTQDFVAGANTHQPELGYDLRMTIDKSGHVGIGLWSPTALLHLKPGTAAAGSAPLKLSAGVTLSTPEPGAIEYDGANLFYTNNSSQRITIASGANSGLPISGGTLSGALNIAATTNSPFNVSTNDALTIASFGNNSTSAALRVESMGAGQSQQLKFYNAAGVANMVISPPSGSSASATIGTTGGLSFLAPGVGVAGWPHTPEGVFNFSSAGTGLNASSGTQNYMRVLPKVDQSGTAGYTGFLVNATETTTGSGLKKLVDFQTGGTSRFVVTSEGRVGINTETPVAQLQVSSGTAHVRVGYSSPSWGVSVLASQEGGWDRSFNFQNAAMTILGGFGGYGSIDSLNYNYIGTSYSNPVAVFLPNRNVGIGTTNPGFKLDVVGSSPARFGTATVTADYGVSGNSMLQRFTGAGPHGIYTDGYSSALAINASNIQLNGASNGNVGIGTTTPARKLDVRSAGYGATIGITRSDSSLQDARLSFEPSGAYSVSNPHWDIGVNAGTSAFRFNVSTGAVSTPMLISADGKVAIGPSSPSANLHVAAPSLTEIRSEATTSGSNSYITAVSNGAGKANLRMGVNNGGNYWAIGADGADNAKLKIAANSTIGTNDIMTVTTLGNVGIGTTNPSVPLHVVGSALISGGVTASGFTTNANVIAGNGTSSSPGFKFFNDGDTGIFLTANNSDTMGFATGAIERMRIDNNGNVGIGTGTPESNLHVRNPAGPSMLTLGNATVTGNNLSDGGIKMYGEHGGAVYSANISQMSSNTFFTLDAPAAGAFIFNSKIQGLGGYGIEAYDNSQTKSTLLSHDGFNGIINSSSGHLVLSSASNVGIGTSAPGYKLEVNGSVAGTGAYNALSDRKFKGNIQTLPDSLTRILKLRGVSFDWKKDENPEMNFDQVHDIGVIAQEVEEVFPEVVHQAPNGVRSVAYSKLIAPLIESTKEIYGLCKASEDQLKRLDERVREHDRQLASQGAEIRRLKNENENLKRRLERLEKAILSK